MYANNINDTVEAEKKLHYFIKKANRSVLTRTILSPRKMFMPKLLNIKKKAGELKAKTFWGDEMWVVLPEEVSTRIWRWQYFEEDVCIFMLNFLKKGMTFVDVGAHFGFFTLLGGYLVGSNGQVLSFEPTPRTYLNLKKNVVDFSRCKNVALSNCAAGSTESIATFYDYGIFNCGYNSSNGARKKGRPIEVEEEFTVKIRKVDDVLKEKNVKKVDFIKIDAESSESDVLKGAQETLIRDKPFVLLEVGDYEISGVTKSRDVIISIQEMDYTAYEVSNGKIVPHTIKEQYEPDKPGNLLFIPKKNKPAPSAR